MSAASRFLLVTPCDPGNCHIYFSVQRRALPTAVALARATGRTLVLPPFEWYEGQAQVFTNVFKKTRQGQTPRFARFSGLFDLPRLNEGGIDAVEFHAAPFARIDRALLQIGSRASTAGRSKALDASPSDEANDLLSTFMEGGGGCKMGRDGLQSNLSWSDGTAPRPLVKDAVGTLYERRVTVGTLRCGAMPLQPAAVTALADWFGDVSVAAIFDVGHYPHTQATDSDGARQLLHGALRPNADLDREAAEHAPVGPFVAVHWRHGDYTDYKILMSPSTVVKRVVDAMSKLDSCAGDRCSIFLMTNCRNSSALHELHAGLPPASPLVTYTPSTERFEEEGRRLVIEQAIAARADAFVGSSRSAVSEWIEMLRRDRRGPGGKDKVKLEL